MRPVRLVAACLLAAAAATGCSDGSAGGGYGTTPTAAPTSAAATTGPGAATTGPGAATTAASAGWTTATKTGTNNPRVPEDMPLLVAIRTGSHDGYDRVVLEFRNDLPSWRVGYVDRVASESGATVPLQGAASLFVDVDPAWAHDQTTSPAEATYTGPRSLTPGYPTLRQVRFVDEFEAHLTFGLGLARRVGFRVVELRGPSRLAIDVAS
jgi:hypothetical protein